MPSHYSDMGFVVNDTSDIQNIINSLFEQGKRIKSKHGDYLLINVDEHIEFWVQLKKVNQVMGLEFHYTSENSFPLRFQKTIKRKHAPKLSGSIYVWNGETFPMILDVPNLDLHDQLKENEIANIQVSAFADSLELFDSEEAYNAAQENKELKYASQCFIPAGMFMTDKKAPPEAYAMFAGVIKTCKKRTNSYSNKEYYYFEVSCLDVVFDVVSDSEFVTKEPVVGGILKGEFWMSGKIL